MGSTIRIQSCPSNCSHFGDDGLKCGHNGHSLLLVAKTSSGFTTLDRTGSVDGRATRTWTWASFASEKSKYVYFKYIKVPGKAPNFYVIPVTEHELNGIYEFNKDDEVRNEPYETGKLIKSYKKGDQITVVASVVNGYGNTWYKTSEGYFVFSGDVDLVDTTTESQQVTVNKTYAASSLEEVKSSMLTYEMSVSRNKIRLCAQATGDNHFKTGMWKTSKLDITKNAGGYCNRAAFSMAMSWLGVDCTPVHMQELGSVDTSKNYTNVISNLNKEKGIKVVRTTASSWNSIKLINCYNCFDTMSNYSPIYIWGYYNGSKNTHAMVIVGKISESNGVARYIVVDPSSKSHNGGHVSWLDVNTKTGKCSDASVSNFKDYSIALILQWRRDDNNDSDESSETALSAVYQFNNDNESRKGPYEDTDVVAKYNEGDIVFVAASLVNKWGNTWYRLEDNSYVYSGDVDKVTFTETTVGKLYKFNKNDESRKWPYESSKLVKSYYRGSVVTVSANLKNTSNNLWYKLSDGSYVYSGDLDEVSSTSNFFFSDVVYPKTFVLNANGWYLGGGTLYSSAGLKSIKSEIKKGSKTISTKTRTISGNSYAVKNLDTGSGDNGVRFSYIKNKGYGTGNYKWILTATDKNGKTLVLNMPFTAVSSGSTKTATMSIDSSNFRESSAEATSVTNEYTDVNGSYTVSGTTATFVKANAIANVTVPTTIYVNGKTVKVTKIADQAFFKNSTVKTVRIGFNVTTIGKYAFTNCINLQYVYDGTGLTTIGVGAFGNCVSLKEITLNQNVSVIGKQAFYNCSSLETIKVLTTKLTLSRVKEGAFSKINSKAVFYVPALRVVLYKTIFTLRGAPLTCTVK